MTSCEAWLLCGFQHTAARRRLAAFLIGLAVGLMFQHTAARRRLGRHIYLYSFRSRVSTHSRPKAAGFGFNTQLPTAIVSTHSRPKAAGLSVNRKVAYQAVSTHSRPKAAGPEYKFGQAYRAGFNTQPPEGGWYKHTVIINSPHVSTHSRPKAAGAITPHISIG